MKLLKAKLVPSQLITPAQRRPVEVRPLELHSRSRALRLGFRMTIWVGRAMLYKIRRRPLDLAMAIEIRLLIEEMGGLWVKTGQLLSLRTDLLNADFSRELSRLQYAAVGFPFDVARRVLETELGQPLEAVFSEFDEHPVAAASICQVHRARLRANGELVAVKVQRPGIEQRFARDLVWLNRLLKSMRFMPGMSFFTWDEMIWETTQIFQEEVDYRYEASNTRRLHTTLDKHDVYVPMVFDCSTQRVLVLEWVPGVLMSSFLEMGREHPEQLVKWCRDNNVDAAKIGEKLFLTFFRQLFEDNLFHGDLHPGNILLLRDSKLALIDFGSAGTNDETLLENYKMSMKGVGDKDFPMAVDYLFLLSDRLPAVNIEAVKAKVVRTYQAWSERAEHRELPYYEKSIGNMGLEAGNVLIENQIVLSWSFMKISRTWATLDASLAALLPDVNYMKLVSKYFKGAKKRSLQDLGKRGPIHLMGRLRTLGVEADMHLEEISRGMLRHRTHLSKAEYVFDVILRVILRVTQLATVLMVGIFILLEVEALQEIVSPQGPARHLIEIVPDLAYEYQSISIGVAGLFLYCILKLRRSLKGLGA